MKRSQSLRQSLDDVKYEQYVNNLNDRLPSLVDPNDIDCQRWPWELVQNAKDTVVKRPNKDDRYVDVIIKYYRDDEGKKKLYFEHNGDQFTDKAITGLIWKFSAEKRNEQFTEDGLSRDKQSTGRFGTGFMTTHALSFTVDISGSLYHGDPGIERNVSVDFTLHREGPGDEEYKKGVDRTEQEIDENMDKRLIKPGGYLPTRFTYHLNKEASEKAAEMGIKNVRLNAAQTMLFCPTVRSITVADEINDSHFKITRKNNDEVKNSVKETVFVEESNDIELPVERRFISIEIEEYSEAISSHWKAKDRNLRLHVAVEVDHNNNILPIPSNSPAVYCSLPLIGFEKMTLPFYINSNDFEPSTERTSLYLKKKRYENRTNEETDTTETYYLQSGINWSIFERSIPLYESIVDYLIENNYNSRFNLVNGLSDVLKAPWTDETKNCLASRFILPLRSMLVKKELVKTCSNYRSIESGIKFVECSKERNQNAFYNICKSVYKNELPVEEENQQWISLKWGRFSFNTDFDEKKSDDENPSFPTIDYLGIAKYIENSATIKGLKLISPNEDLQDGDNSSEDNDAIKLVWLNLFYEWIATAGLPILAQMKIVPNRLGEFCSCEQGGNLKDASEIPTSVFDFMKKIQIDWDAELLMEGIMNVPLDKATKADAISAIKDRAKEIRIREVNSPNALIPLLMALPNNEDGRVDEFYNKRVQIVSILKTMFRTETNNFESTTLELKAETWEETDNWFMGIVAKMIADRKRLDRIDGNETDDELKKKYCTAEWLAKTLDFMFKKQYLHQEDVTYKDDKSDTLSIIPNRYGDFYPINQLHLQGSIPNELLVVELNKTGYDVNSELLYAGFTLNEKVSITDLTVTKLATTYNSFFASEAEDNDKLSVAKYLIHLIPEFGDQFKEIRELYNIFTNADENERKTTTISTSDLNIWTGAKEFLIKYLCSEASKLSDLKSIGQHITRNQVNNNLISEKDYSEIGMNWLNRISTILENSKLDLSEDIKIVPDWYGKLHAPKEIIYDGTKLINGYKDTSLLVSLLDGDLWTHFPDEEKEDGDEYFTGSISHPYYCFANNYQDNTDEKLFGLVDKLVSYCSENNSTEWRTLLKSSIQTLLSFFDKNNNVDWICKDDPKFTRLFRKTYLNRKNLSYDFIYDAETKARISRINENFSPEEIEDLINEQETVKNILARKEYYTSLEEENHKLIEKIEGLSGITDIIKDCTPDQLDQVKELVSRLTVDGNLNVGGETPTGGDDKVVPKVEIVPETYEIDVVDYLGNIQHVKTDQVQYAGLSLEEIEQYVSEAKAAVVKFFRELNEREHLGLQFDTEKIGRNSYSQLYGISDSNGKEIPLVVHSYKGPQYRYFDLNWYDWQQLSRPGSMLWVLTVSGLQCLPLYALPIRNFNFSLDSSMSNEGRAALLTLAQVGKQYNQVSFDFGNNMPHGFVNPVAFDYVPTELKDCVESIKQVCDANLPSLSGIYNNARNIPIMHSLSGYSRALKEMETSETQREIFESAPNNMKPPVVGTSFIE